jgi:hypothetical protein
MEVVEILNQRKKESFLISSEKDEIKSKALFREG